MAFEIWLLRCSLLQASQAMLGSLIKRFTGSEPLPTPQLESIEVGSKVRVTRFATASPKAWLNC